MGRRTMRGAVLLAVVLATVVGWGPSPVLAGDTEYHYRPFEITLFPPIQIFQAPNKVVVGPSINVLYGRATAVYGIEVGGVLNIERERFAGVQAAPINLVGGPFYGIQGGVVNVVGRLYGIQAAPLWNSVREGGIGLQGSAFINLAGDDFGGLQLGTANLASGDLSGLQLSWTFNGAGGDVGGVQLALGNAVGGDLSGLQVGPILNWVVRDVSGVQLGMVNIAGKVPTALGSLSKARSNPNPSDRSEVRGLQIALITNITASVQGIQVGPGNVTETVTGLQLGLVNQAGRVNGLQIGAMNFCTVLNGVQIGGINVATDNFIPFMLGLNVGW
ncbi:MAG: hypothetical protein FJ109_14955 [Deltaproteobacteria bacterium]|nr:hypothetical protein [Deltaproteobacteria bacterium]